MHAVAILLHGHLSGSIVMPKGRLVNSQLTLQFNYYNNGSRSLYDPNIQLVLSWAFGHMDKSRSSHSWLLNRFLGKARFSFQYHTILYILDLRCSLVVPVTVFNREPHSGSGGSEFPMPFRTRKGQRHFSNDRNCFQKVLVPFRTRNHRKHFNHLTISYVCSLKSFTSFCYSTYILPYIISFIQVHQVA